MRIRWNPAGAALIVALLAAPLWAEEENALLRYAKAPDDSYGWTLVSTVEKNECKVSTIRLQSQTWRGLLWQHRLVVVRPKQKTKDMGILLIAGGRNRPDMCDRLPSEIDMLIPLARSLGALVAVVSQVPNQPLFDGKNEDEIISHTFNEFLKTGDPTWPLLLPMVKSVLRAMDALGEFTQQTFSQKTDSFLLTGASKRGWTTWLTAAVDQRVKAMAPMVIDMLNLQKQMPHQIACWGSYSEQIEDYTRLGIQGSLGNSRGKELVRIVDPYFHRHRIRMPKFIILGTNDKYWPVDAARHYFFDFEGPSFLRNIPNAGHGLNLTVVPFMASVYRLVTSGKPLPDFTWTFEKTTEKARLSIKTRTPAVDAALWTAHAPKRDFRSARWTISETPSGERTEYVFEVPLPATGWVALYGSVTFPCPGGGKVSLSTSVDVFSREGEGKKGN